MEIHDSVRRWIEKNKDNLLTDADAYTVLKNFPASNAERGELGNVFISSGVHVEKYMNVDDLFDYFLAESFFAPVELHLDSIHSIIAKNDVWALSALRNVKSIYLPKCTRIFVDNGCCIMVGCPDLEYLYLPNCEDITDLSKYHMFAKCPKLEKVAIRKHHTLSAGVWDRIRDILVEV